MKREPLTPELMEAARGDLLAAGWAPRKYLDGSHDELPVAYLARWRASHDDARMCEIILRCADLPDAAIHELMFEADA